MKRIGAFILFGAVALSTFIWNQATCSDDINRKASFPRLQVSEAYSTLDSKRTRYVGDLLTSALSVEPVVRIEFFELPIDDRGVQIDRPISLLIPSDELNWIDGRRPVNGRCSLSLMLVAAEWEGDSPSTVRIAASIKDASPLVGGPRAYWRGEIELQQMQSAGTRPFSGEGE